MTCTPSFAASSLRVSPTRRFRSSVSTTQGPAMRNGDAPPPKWGAMSVVVAGELGRGGSGPLLRGARAFSCPVLRARRADEAREQRVRPGRPGLELRMELAADEPGVIGSFDISNDQPSGRQAEAANPFRAEQVAIAVHHSEALGMRLRPWRPS